MRWLVVAAHAAEDQIRLLVLLWSAEDESSIFSGAVPLDRCVVVFGGDPEELDLYPLFRPALSGKDS